MTLIYASATPEIAFLVADTLLSPPFELKGHIGPVNGKFHGLKAQILNSDTAVAFATSNNAQTCLDLTSGLHAELTRNPATNVCERLSQSYEKAIGAAEGEPPDCEFLVLQLTAQGKRLAKVTRNEVNYVTRAYIGHPAEYKRMMGLRRPYAPPNTQLVQQPDGSFCEMPLAESSGEIEFEEISRAMEELVLKRQSDSVGAIGGCIVRIVDARISGKLEYLQQVESGLSPWEGHSGFSMSASNSGVRGIAVYYRAGKFGFLFVVGDSEYCRKEYAETLHDFVEGAKTRYGLNLTGGTWTA